MYALPALFVATLLCLGELSEQFPQTQLDADSTLPQNITLPEELEKKNCSTARNVQGNCVPREICDYSTYAIDLTLYMPRYYKKPCVVGQVCCPFDSQLAPQPAYDSSANNYGFDDDDRR